jgi:hypothetical protein
VPMLRAAMQAPPVDKSSGIFLSEVAFFQLINLLV